VTFETPALRQTQAAVRRQCARREKEAARIARALHDEAGQLLATVYLAVAEVARDLPPPARERLRHVTTLLDQVSEQLREIAHELHPVILDDLGLVPALELLSARVSKRGGFGVTVDAAIKGKLPLPIETAIYRILQEALNNVRKHARARRVRVKLWRDSNAVHYSIADDGVGCDYTSLRQPGRKRGLGLLGIRERLADLGGTLAMTTAPCQGMTLEMSIPLKTLVSESAAGMLVNESIRTIRADTPKALCTS
jgi:signal transduction histidine kinase